MKILKYSITTLIGILIFAAIFYGCSGGSDPLAPGLQPTIDPVAEPALTDREVASLDSGHMLWGFYTVSINPENLSWEIVPVRDVASHWNILRFLENGPCTNCFTLVGLAPSGNGTLLVDVKITHPFGSMKNLTGFDVRGIAMFDGSKIWPVSGLIMSDPSDGEGAVVNPDGWTTLYNPETGGSGPGGFQGYNRARFTTPTYPAATLNPYKIFVSDDPANTRNAFFAGDQITVQYEIDMPTAGNFIFGYAVDACWAPPSTKPVTDPITQFPPTANCPEPWKIDVSETPINEGLTHLGGATVLTIDIYDWQPGTHNLPVIECPELFAGTITGALLSEGTDFSSCQLTAVNTELAGIGIYEALISVEDDENESSDDWLDLTAYKIISLEVIEGTIVPPDEDPIAAAIADPTTQLVNEPVSFSDNGSYDPDGGAITLYEWDWNNDGTFDETGSDISHSWSTAGNYFVQFRVTDDESATATLANPIEITIENGVPEYDPIAAATADPTTQFVEESISFSDNGSSDPDGGSITLFEWDWNNDGAYDETGANVSHSWNSAGTKYVQFRVTDDEDATDTLNSPIEITIEAVSQGDDPVAAASASTTTQYVCDDIHFSDNGSYDPDGGSITLFEWDIDNNGTYDYTGSTLDHSWNSPGTYYVQLRVTDDESATDLLDTPIEISIINQLPTASANASDNSVVVDASLNFDASDSTDNDCGGNSITNYLWEWESDELSTGNAVSSLEFSDYGDQTVNLTVTDNEGGQDSIDTPFSIRVVEGWARTMGGTGLDNCLDAGTDLDGNIYTTGYFANTVDFDPGPGSVNKTSAGGNDVFLCKFNPQGELVWVKTWGGPGEDTAAALAVDDSLVVCVAGTFDGSDVDFDPGTGTDLHSTSGLVDTFISQFDIAGNHFWTITFGGESYDIPLDIAIGNTGNISVAGMFMSTSADFDPGAGTDTHSSNGQFDAFTACYSPSGSWLWAHSYGGSGIDGADGIGTSSVGNVATTGFYGGSVDFNPGGGPWILTSTGGSDIFVTLHNSAGGLQWASGVGGASDDGGLGVNFTTDGRVCIAGAFAGTCDFDPGAPTQNRASNGSEDAFLLMLSSFGTYSNVLTWGGSDSDYAKDINIDSYAAFYISGTFKSTDADFDPCPDTYIKSSNGDKDVFLLKLNSACDFQWARTFGGVSGENSENFCVFENTFVYFPGYFMGTVDFDPHSTYTDSHSSLGMNDGFIVRLRSDGNW